MYLQTKLNLELLAGISGLNGKALIIVFIILHDDHIKNAMFFYVGKIQS